MILTVDDFLAMGFKVSVDGQEVLRAIEEAEFFYIKSVIGDDLYIRYSSTVFDPGTLEYILLNGGVYNNLFFSGLKRAVANIAFAFLLRMNVNAVRFGTVRKEDENSSNVEENLLYNASKHHFTIGKAYLKEFADYYDCDWKNANGCQFDEWNNLI